MRFRLRKIRARIRRRLIRGRVGVILPRIILALIFLFPVPVFTFYDALSLLRRRRFPLPRNRKVVRFRLPNLVGYGYRPVPGSPSFRSVRV
jgi:hypothetical protein